MLANTRHIVLLVFATALAVASLIGPALAAATPTPAPAGNQQGIIMRDGGVCDPIRHMGC